MNRFKRYLSKEIDIEFKACMYFFCILFFVCLHQLSLYRLEVPILTLAEIIFTTYLMGYLQVYLLQNFDEADKFGVKGGLRTLLCVILYTFISYLCNWFDRSLFVTLLFFLYMFLAYYCLFLVYKIKRVFRTKELNHNLATFKARREKDEEREDES